VDGKAYFVAGRAVCRTAFLRAFKKAWRDVLKIAGPATAEAIHGAHRAAAKTAHPDAGGSAQAMAEINDARDRALREIGAK